MFKLNLRITQKTRLLSPVLRFVAVTIVAVFMMLIFPARRSIIKQYTRGVTLKNTHAHAYTCRYSATMALIQSHAMDQLAVYLDDLIRYASERLFAFDESMTSLTETQAALSETQRYSSFMNLAIPIEW